jgi:hypothetical protein
LTFESFSCHRFAMNLPSAQSSDRSYFLHGVFAAVLLLSAIALALVGISCQRSSEASGDSVHLQPKEPPSEAKVSAAQKRVNSFFYQAVVPKLTTCWNKVAGEGQIEFKFTYRKEGRSWKWQQVEKSWSRLSKAEDAAALDCMQSSSGGSSFPMEPAEIARHAQTLTIYWSWPVPFPSDTSELARMINTRGSIDMGANCKDCVYDPTDHRSYCARRFTGWVNCSGDSDGTGCQMTGGTCFSGWSGVWAPISIAQN